MNTILNLPLNTLKPIILEEELKALKKKFEQSGPKSGGIFVLSITKLMNQIYKIQSFQEMIYFVMEGSDMTQEEAKQYISGLLFERTVIYN